MKLSKQAETSLTVAVVATVLCGLAAFFAMGIGMNTYLDDYCATATDLPGEAANWSSVSGARFANPITIECKYDDVPVQRTDPRPLISTVGLLTMVIWAVALLGRWVHRSRRMRESVAPERTRAIGGGLERSRG